MKIFKLETNFKKLIHQEILTTFLQIIMVIIHNDLELVIMNFIKIDLIFKIFLKVLLISEEALNKNYSISLDQLQ